MAIYIHGTGFQKHTVAAAVGPEATGTKRVPGVIEGATEDAEVVSDLLGNLRDRGLETTHRALFFLEGSKALKKAVRANLGERAMIQRCILH